MEAPRPGRRARVRTGIVVVLSGLAVLALGWSLPGVDRGQLLPLLLLAIAAATVEVWAISLYGDSRVSLSFVAVAAGAILGGPAGGAVVALAAGAGTASRQRAPEKLAFNISVLVLSGAAMGLTLESLQAWSIGRHDVFEVAEVGVATLVNFALNSSLVAVVIGLSTRQSPLAVWLEKFRWLALHYLVMGLVGFGVAQAYVIAGVPGLLLFLLPAAMQRVSIQQYVRRTREHVDELKTRNLQLTDAHRDVTESHRQVSALARELEHTYDGTLVALVSALDARDSDTRGHSERVGRHTRSIATLMGILPESEEGLTIYRGALLHDIGKIGVRDGVLLKPGKLTSDESDEMRRHPVIGFDMLREVPFLRGASEIILAHHEQWDGKGYPRGLKRDEIPLGAHLFAVADCFDAMMSNRPYRRAMRIDETLAELRRFRGTQFAPDAVDAVFELYERWLLEYPDHPDFRFKRAA